MDVQNVRLRSCAAETAIDAVRAGMTLFIEPLSAEPIALTSVLWERARELEDLTVITGLLTAIRSSRPRRGETSICGRGSFPGRCWPAARAT